ncbi:hypothetical protein EOM82_05450 [bacterium]|nr:hypothetical protein [bacterium]
MWLFNRFRKVKREDVINSIIELENEEKQAEDKIFDHSKRVEELTEQAKKNKTRETRLFIAKKIESVNLEKSDAINRALYLLYNIRLLNRLKTAIDDKNFSVSIGKMPLNKLLKNQHSLAVFLNRALKTKVLNENIMTSADDTFKEVSELYEVNEEIYGASKSDDELLAMFELNDSLEEQSQMADDINAFAVNNKEAL